jgi:hypothetical protein
MLISHDACVQILTKVIDSQHQLVQTLTPLLAKALEPSPPLPAQAAPLPLPAQPRTLPQPTFSPILNLHIPTEQIIEAVTRAVEGAFDRRAMAEAEPRRERRLDEEEDDAGAGMQVNLLGELGGEKLGRNDAGEEGKGGRIDRGTGRALERSPSLGESQPAPPPGPRHPHASAPASEEDSPIPDSQESEHQASDIDDVPLAAHSPSPPPPSRPPSARRIQPTSRPTSSHKRSTSSAQLIPNPLSSNGRPRRHTTRPRYSESTFSGDSSSTSTGRESYVDGLGKQHKWKGKDTKVYRKGGERGATSRGGKRARMEVDVVDTASEELWAEREERVRKRMKERELGVRYSSVPPSYQGEEEDEEGVKESVRRYRKRGRRGPGRGRERMRLDSWREKQASTQPEAIGTGRDVKEDGDGEERGEGGDMLVETAAELAGEASTSYGFSYHQQQQQQPDTGHYHQRFRFQPPLLPSLPSRPQSAYPLLRHRTQSRQQNQQPTLSENQRLALNSADMQPRFFPPPTALPYPFSSSPPHPTASWSNNRQIIYVPNSSPPHTSPSSHTPAVPLPFPAHPCEEASQHLTIQQQLYSLRPRARFRPRISRIPSPTSKPIPASNLFDPSASVFAAATTLAAPPSSFPLQATTREIASSTTSAAQPSSLNRSNPTRSHSGSRQQSDFVAPSSPPSLHFGPPSPSRANVPPFPIHFSAAPAAATTASLEARRPYPLPPALSHTSVSHDGVDSLLNSSFLRHVSEVKNDSLQQQQHQHQHRSLSRQPSTPPPQHPSLNPLHPCNSTTTSDQPPASLPRHRSGEKKGNTPARPSTPTGSSGRSSLVSLQGRKRTLLVAGESEDEGQEEEDEGEEGEEEDADADEKEQG